MFRTGNLHNWTLWVGLELVMLVPLSGARAGSYEVLYSFKGGSDGARPLSSLLADNAGNFYGTTWSGGGGRCGHHGCGTVFRLAPDGTETVLYAFKGGSDGINPPGGVIADKAGNLYGVTESGGTSGLGTVFELAPDNTETILHSFSGNGDGTAPQASLIADKAGNLYGTTIEGGSRSQNCRDAYGCGTVFKVAPDLTETVLYSFCVKRYCADGMWPVAGLLLDEAANLYGTTSTGGVANCESLGCGTVFKLLPDGNEKVLYAFTFNTDGAYPDSNLITDGQGNLYSTGADGGGGTAMSLKLLLTAQKPICILFRVG